MIYGSVCSGIEAASVAWEPLGWRAAFLSEIDAFPRAVLRHHFPETPLHGDFTTIGGDQYGPIDVICGGTPCQDYSVAGLRAGLDGDRGSLTLEFSRLAYRSRARWLLWENVPGVFSTNGGRDFGAILATFSGRHGSVFEPPEGGWRNAGIVEEAEPENFGLAWRVLDAQYFGVPQRRRRVFVVGYIGNWRRAAAVLFERHSLQRHNPPSRQTRKDVAGTLGASLERCSADEGERGTLVADTLEATAGRSRGAGTPVGMLTGAVSSKWSKGTGGPAGDECYNLVAEPAVAFDWKMGERARSIADAEELSPTIGAQADRYAVAFQPTPILEAGARTGISPDPRAGSGIGEAGDPMFTLQAGKQHAVAEICPPLTAEADKGDQDPVIFQTRIARNGRGQPSEIAPALNGADAGETSDMRPCVAFTVSDQSNGFAWERDYAPTLDAQIPNDTSYIQKGLRLGSVVRRLTPRECERLQGFPDDWTLVPYRGAPAVDGPRYKAIGNSMAVPVMRWIGERIAIVDAIPEGEQLQAAE